MMDRAIKNIQMSSADRRAACRMAAVCNRYGAVFFACVGVDDVLDVDALQADEAAEGPARRRAPLTFDFLVCLSNGRPVLALDICTRPARRKRRARREEETFRRKDQLTRKAGLTYLRVHSTYVRGNAARVSLLSWCAEQWFLYRAPADGDEQPPNDLFAPGLDLVAWPGNLYQDLEVRLGRLRGGLGIASCRLEFELGRGEGGRALGLGTMVLDDAWGFAARCEIHAQNAAGPEEDLLRVILVKHLLHRFRRFELGGKCKKRKEIQRRRRKFRRRCRVENTGLFGWGF